LDRSSSVTWVSARIPGWEVIGRAKIAAVTGQAGRRSRRDNFLLVLIMTALVVLAAPLASLVMGVGGDQTPEGERSPAVAPTGQSEDPSAEPTAEPKPEFSADAVIATFNVLGNSHTKAEGKLPEMAAGKVRLRKALKLLDRAQVSVVGLQELQRPQAQEFERVADGWQLFHSAADSENAIAWQPKLWEQVKTRTVGVPYFNGSERRMPVVKLRHLKTGRAVWFINVHNPADTPQFPGQDDHRAAAIKIEAALVKELSRGKAPVVLMGDLNLKAEAFCYFTESGLLQSATGESREEPCQDPAYDGIDWIFGTKDLTFSGWDVRRDDEVKAASDHPLVSVNLTFER
jgi:endonuclease/exonuclease/phosphatase family metal-dependent hydrolase